MNKLDNYIPLAQTYLSLKENQVFKNYKELCNYLSQPIGTGNKKIYQLQDFERYFEFHKQGHKIIIDNVYSEPLTDFSKGIYSNLIQKLLLDLMTRELKRGNHKLLFSKGQLYNALYMVNSGYAKGKHNQEQLIKALDIRSYDIKEFYSRIESSLNNMLKRSLKSLASKSLIDYNEVTVMCISYMIDDDTMETSIKVATDEERKFILEMQKEVLEEIQCSDIKEVVLKNKWEIFNNKTIDKINNNLINIPRAFYEKVNYYYNAYDIVFISSISDEIDKLEQYILKDKDNVANNLNKELVQRYKEGYKKKHSQAVEEFESMDFMDYYKIGKYQLERLDNRRDEIYITNGHKLIDYGIKI